MLTKTQQRADIAERSHKSCNEQIVGLGITNKYCTKLAKESRLKLRNMTDKFDEADLARSQLTIDL